MKKITSKADLMAMYESTKGKLALRLATDKLNKKGHHPVEMTDQEKCIACAFCATMCPDCVITVER